jgi:hypothetical protein
MTRKIKYIIKGRARIQTQVPMTLGHALTTKLEQLIETPFPD